MRGLLQSVAKWIARPLAHSPSRVPSTRILLREFEELGARIVPTVYHVTSGADSGTGSLRAALADAVTNGNQADIVIDDGVTTIALDSPLVNGVALNLTLLTIETEDDHDVAIAPSFGNEHSYQFIDHVGNNGMTITLRHLDISNFGTSGDGGAVSTVAPLVLDSCDFLYNDAGGNGGAIYAQYSVDMTNCYFYFNQATDSGGAIYAEPLESGAGVTLTDTVFELNIAGGDGGAIYFAAGVGTLGIYGDLTAFRYNSATGNGGAIYQHFGTIEAISSSSADPAISGFEYNVAGGTGNDLYLTDLAAAHIDVVVNESGDPSIYLVSTIPPAMSGYWAYVNTARIAGGYGALYTNWPV